MTHSSFIVLLPAYFFILRLGGGDVRGVFGALVRDTSLHADNLASKWRLGRGTLGNAGRVRVIAGVVFLLTVGLTVPSLSWFLAVPLTSMGNITAIYNTFSIWALVFAVAVLGEPWRVRDVGSVLLACGGVALVAYGGSSESHTKGSRPIFGDGLALLGAVSMAAYETIYRILATFDEGSTEGYAPLAEQPQSEQAVHESYGASDTSYSPLPFGLFAIAMTSGIGLMTSLLFWAPLLAAHVLGWESLGLPSDLSTLFVILLSVVCGVTFNGAFSACMLTSRIAFALGACPCIRILSGHYCIGATGRHCARNAMVLV